MKNKAPAIREQHVMAAIVVLATLFTLGRSLVVARETTNAATFKPPAAPARVATRYSTQVPNTPDVASLHLMDVALARRDPMDRGGPAAPAVARATPPPPVVHPVVAPTFDVTAPVLMSSLGDFAIIRTRSGVDRAVRVGDTMDEFVVRVITADAVTLSAGEREITLRLRDAR